MDVYESKKQDLWGQIIAAQYKEDEDNKIKVHEEKLKRNHDFGVTFRKDLEDIRWRRENAVDDDIAILKIVEEKSKAADEVQQQRKRDAILRQKQVNPLLCICFCSRCCCLYPAYFISINIFFRCQFIANCLEDIGIKRKQRADELDTEMEASAMMIEKNKALIREDEEKAAREKARMKKQMDDLYREGQETIAKRQREKEEEWKYVAKIQREAAIKADKEEQRRKDDLAAMLRNAKDGPAHGVTERLIKASNDYKNEQLRILRHAGEFFHTLCTHKMYYASYVSLIVFFIGNGLNAQLLSSEEQTLARSNSDYSAVMKDNDAIAKKNLKLRQDDHEFNLKMGQLALQRSLEFQAQERKNKEAKIAAGLKYQEELNAQLKMTKERKLKAIQETMVKEERKMNMALFRRYPSIKTDTTPGTPSDKLKALREREAAEPRGPEVKIGKFKMR